MVVAAKQLARECSVHGEGMFITGLSPTGNPPATHYVSSGHMDAQFQTALLDGLALHNAATVGAQQQNIPKVATQQQALDLVGNSTVQDESENPHDLFARIGLKIINTSV